MDPLPSGPTDDASPTPPVVRVGEWTFDPAAGTLDRPGTSRRLEPKVADLLALLVARAGTVVTREELDAALWPDVVVGDDALPRCVSKLRKALGDDPKAPRYVETVPKRGYRLIEAPSPPVETPSMPSETAASDPPTRRWRRGWLFGLVVALALAAHVVMLVVGSGTGPSTPPPRPPGEPPAAMLTERAEDFYFQIDRAGNESAIELFERALAADPDFAPAHAGLANALVQRVLRYPTSEEAPAIDPVNLGNALSSGRLDTTEARLHLERALGLAERAVRLAPDDAASHKALGFVTSALGRPEQAIHAYERALALDADAWDVSINLGDLYEIRGESEAALDYYEQTYETMTRVYAEQSSRVRPWYADMGVAIGIRHERAQRPWEAEAWYRRVLAHAPFHPAATCALARLLRAGGDAPAADRLVEERTERTAEPVDCAEILASLVSRID